MRKTSVVLFSVLLCLAAAARGGESKQSAEKLEKQVPIELDYPDMKALDHMSLLKFDDGWRIVVKAYEASTPAQGG